jgi:two-component system cell cycle sensor histidine kinase/response regulator CckA
MDTPGKQILIVDDEPQLLKMMAIYLRRLGFTVMTADSTDRAWAEAEPVAGEIALAVLDATMNGLASETVAMRLLEANRALFVVMASGYPVDMAALEDAGPGRVTFLHKPFGPDKLALVIRRMLGAEEEGV